jgi:ABC-type transport system substrate-binding protein
MILYALHDALVADAEKTMASSLAESWSTSPDGLVYESLRRGATFHNGESRPRTPCSRSSGTAASRRRCSRRRSPRPRPCRVRFRLKQPRPDFGVRHSATGAWIVPRKYVEKVGRTAAAPIGGPYKFAPFTLVVSVLVPPTAPGTRTPSGSAWSSRRSWTR